MTSTILMFIKFSFEIIWCLKIILVVWFDFIQWSTSSARLIIWAVHLAIGRRGRSLNHTGSPQRGGGRLEGGQPRRRGGIQQNPHPSPLLTPMRSPFSSSPRSTSRARHPPQAHHQTPSGGAKVCFSARRHRNLRLRRWRGRSVGQSIWRRDGRSCRRASPSWRTSSRASQSRSSAPRTTWCFTRTSPSPLPPPPPPRRRRLRGGGR